MTVPSTSARTYDLPGVESLGDLRGQRVLVRADLNVPMDGDRIADDGRIRASVPQIRDFRWRRSPAGWGNYSVAR